MPRTLKFEVANDIAHIFATAVTDTLDTLGYHYDFDETSPHQNENGEVEYKVYGVSDTPVINNEEIKEDDPSD